jgi:hypothetical protein
VFGSDDGAAGIRTDWRTEACAEPTVRIEHFGLNLNVRTIAIMEIPAGRIEGSGCACDE